MKHFHRHNKKWFELFSLSKWNFPPSVDIRSIRVFFFLSFIWLPFLTRQHCFNGKQETPLAFPFFLFIYSFTCCLPNISSWNPVSQLDFVWHWFSQNGRMSNRFGFTIDWWFFFLNMMLDMGCECCGSWLVRTLVWFEW